MFGRKKRANEIWADLAGMSPLGGAPGATPPIYDPNEAQQEYAPASAPSAAPHRGFNWGRAAMAAFGGQPVIDMFHRRDEDQRAQAEQQQLLGMARQVIKDPAEWAAFQVDPKKWAETRLGDQYGFHDMAPGHTGAYGNPARGGNTYTAPETFNNGPDRVQYDANSGQSNVVYQGKDDWTRYADSLGLQPGTPQYAAAQKDFALRAQGPDAFQQQQALQSQRFSDQQALRSMPTYGQTHPSAGGGRAARPTATRVVGGKAYYKVHGQWYDNPEGN